MCPIYAVMNSEICIMTCHLDEFGGFALSQLFPDNWDTHFDILALDLEVSLNSHVDGRKTKPTAD